MAKKQSNTSENSAASQSAKPGMFIPIPTAEITNAAETARIRAEKEAGKKADKKVADEVVALIRAIGVVEYTDACLKKINAAKQAYTKLTADQKKLVENADVITTSEKEYDKLKIAAEKEAKERADKKAADAVVALISAIGVVEYTNTCLKKINAAKIEYSKLTADQKKLVENADVIAASEKEYDRLKIAAEKAAEEARVRAEREAKEKADKKAADAVVVLISAIGTVEYTDVYLKKINTAKQAYAKLSADQKKLVENADVISSSKKDYNELKSAIDKQAADEVITMIKNIGVIECTSDCVAKINVAKLAYDKLSPDQEGLVDMQVGDILLRMADVAKRYAAVIAEKRANERTEKEAEAAARKKAEEEARKKAEQEAHDKEIESILLAYCKKKGSSLTSSSSRDHAEYDMPRNRYDDIYEYVMRKNKEQGNFYISLDGYDYFFSAGNNNYGISVWRKINTDGLWDLNEKKKQIDRTSKIFTIGLVVLWAFFLIVNAIYTWVANSWFSCIIWVIITFAVFFGIMSLMQKIDEEHPIETKSPDAGTIARLAWRICWVLGLSVISEIIMIVIFVF